MRKISQEELDERIKLHELWLKEEGGERLDVSRCDLQELDFSRSNFSGAYFSGANFTDANFTDANFLRANFSFANFSGANFSHANFSLANFSDAVGLPPSPIIENIDKKLLKILESEENSLDMYAWHTCETTHCRAGWYIVLAGDEGRKLEEELRTNVAGALIFHASYPKKRIPDWCADNDDALEDIRRNASEKD